MPTMYTKWLRYAIIGGLFATLFIPFIIANGSMFPNMFFPFITGKNFLFRIIVELMFGLYVILALAEPKYRPRFSFVLAAVAAWVVWAGIATVASVDPLKSFWSNFERMEGYITVLHLGMYFLTASMMLGVEKLWTRFFQTSVGAGVIMSCYALLQLGGAIAIDQGSTRVTGTLGNAAYMAVYMLFGIFFAIFLLARERGNATLRYVYGASAFLFTIILFYTQTRGTVLGLVGGIIAAALFMLIETRRMPEWRSARRIAAWVLGGTVLCIAGFVAVRDVPAVRDSAAFGRLASISLSDKTTVSRFMVWDMAWQGFKEKPLFGWGQENFSYVFNKHYNPAMFDQEQWFDRAHDAFIDWAINGGAPGFLSFLALFAAAAFALWRARTLSVWERAALMALLAGYAVHDLFVFDNLISYLLFFSVLALAHDLSQRDVPSSVAMTRPMPQEHFVIAAPLVAALTLVGVWWLNAGGIANATGLLRAVMAPGSTAAAPKSLEENLTAFKTVLSGAPLGRQEAVEQLLQFAPQVSQMQSISPELKQQFVNAALDAISAMTQQRPGDARLELFFGAFLDTYGQHDAGAQHLIAALRVSPDKQQILFELGENNLLRAGNTAEALAVLKHAYELDTTYDTALVYYVSALYQNGDNAAADALLQERFGTTVPDNSALLQALSISKQYARAEAILAARLAKKPADTQSWLQYAAMFYASGDKEGTIAALKKGAAANPSFETQASQLISQLQADQAPAPTQEE